MNAREKFIEQVKPLLETPHAQWTKQAYEEGVRRTENLGIHGRLAGFFMDGWGAATQGQNLIHGKEDLHKEKNSRSFAYDLGQEWVMLNPRPAEKNAAGFVIIPSREIVLKHKTGQTRFNLILDFHGLTAFIKRLGRMPLSRFA